ncbi:Fic family protein, partial [Arthrobacter koreensis]
GQVHWADLNAEQFAMSSAALFSFVNHAHPFREGNGRTSKIFMEHVAEQSNFTLDFSQVDRDLWNATSEASRPKPERPYLDPLPLVKRVRPCDQRTRRRAGERIGRRSP